MNPDDVSQRGVGLQARGTELVGCGTLVVKRIRSLRHQDINENDEETRNVDGF